MKASDEDKCDEAETCWSSSGSRTDCWSCWNGLIHLCVSCYAFSSNISSSDRDRLLLQGMLGNTDWEESNMKQYGGS